MNQVWIFVFFICGIIFQFKFPVLSIILFHICAKLRFNDALMGMLPLVPKALARHSFHSKIILLASKTIYKNVLCTACIIEQLLSRINEPSLDFLFFI